MVTLATLAASNTRIEKAIAGTDEPQYGDLNRRFWDQRSALNMAATYLIPNTPEEALFLHTLIEEYTEFVEDEPTRESDREDAIEAILRVNDSLKDYNIST